MKQIELRGGTRRRDANGWRYCRGDTIVGYATVDNDLFEEVNRYPWFKDDTGYARTNVQIPGVASKRPAMHQLIQQLRGRVVPARYETDHKDRDTLNNQSDNLLVKTRSENNANQGKRRDNSSGLKGVSLFRSNGVAKVSRWRWRAQVRKNGQQVLARLFPFTEEGKSDAGRAVNEAYRIHYPDAMIPNPT